jgi:hypothetical protein
VALSKNSDMNVKFNNLILNWFAYVEFLKTKS